MRQDELELQLLNKGNEAIELEDKILKLEKLIDDKDEEHNQQIDDLTRRMFALQAQLNAQTDIVQAQTQKQQEHGTECAQLRQSISQIAEDSQNKS